MQALAIAVAAFVALVLFVWHLPDISPLRRFGYRAWVHPPAGNVGYHSIRAPHGAAVVESAWVA